MNLFGFDTTSYSCWTGNIKDNISSDSLAELISGIGFVKIDTKIFHSSQIFLSDQ